MMDGLGGIPPGGRDPRFTGAQKPTETQNQQLRERQREDAQPTREATDTSSLNVSASETAKTADLARAPKSRKTDNASNDPKELKKAESVTRSIEETAQSNPSRLLGAQGNTLTSEKVLRLVGS